MLTRILHYSEKPRTLVDQLDIELHQLQPAHVTLRSLAAHPRPAFPQSNQPLPPSSILIARSGAAAGYQWNLSCHPGGGSLVVIAHRNSVRRVTMGNSKGVVLHIFV